MAPRQKVPDHSIEDGRVCQAGGRTAAGRLKEPKEEMMSFYKRALRNS